MVALVEFLYLSLSLDNQYDKVHGVHMYRVILIIIILTHVRICALSLFNC